jgi:hypothetical protein
MASRPPVNSGPLATTLTPSRLQPSTIQREYSCWMPIALGNNYSAQATFSTGRCSRIRAAHFFREEAASWLR